MTAMNCEQCGIPQRRADRVPDRRQMVVSGSNTGAHRHTRNTGSVRSGGSAGAGGRSANRQHVLIRIGYHDRRDADTVLDAGREVQRSGGGHERGLSREVMADQAVVVIMLRTVVVVLIAVARLRMLVVGCGMRVVVMTAAVSMAVRFTGRDLRAMGMAVPDVLNGVQSAVAEERNAAVNGKQAPADQVVDAGRHRSPLPTASANVRFARHIDSVRWVRSWQCRFWRKADECFVCAGLGVREGRDR